jgi:hypothetical protein
MAKELAPDILLFGQDDQEFVEWCHANHDGFVWNCVRDAAGIFPFMLHAAIRNGDLCQHFRNSKRASGYEANLTTAGYCKVCSIRLSSLEQWAQAVRPDFIFGECSSCLGLS